MSIKDWFFPKAKEATFAFAKCGNCGRNKLPSDLFCPHCNYVEAAEVRGWIYTGPAAARARCDNDGKQPVPFRSAVGDAEHPGVVMSVRVFKAIKLETKAKDWVPIAMAMDKDGRAIVYMIYVEDVDRGRGGFVVDRLAFPDLTDNAILRLATSAKRAGSGFYMEVE